MTRVFGGALDRGESPHVLTLLAKPEQVAETTAGGEGGVAVVETLTAVRRGAQLDVEPHLFGEVVSGAATPDQQREAAKEGADHARSSTPAIAPATRW